MTSPLFDLWREIRSDLDGDADVDLHSIENAAGADREPTMKLDYIAIFPYLRSHAHCKREVERWAEDNSLEVSCLGDQINVRLTTTPG